jgi:hypothetical protein
MSNPVTQLTQAQFDAQKHAAVNDNYFDRVVEEADVNLNVDTGGLPGQTISGRAADDAVQGKWWGKLACKFLNLFQKNHGAIAQADEVGHAESVIAKDTKYDGDLN